MTNNNKPLGRKARDMEFVTMRIRDQMPLPVELQVRCPAIPQGAPVEWCYLKGARCDCLNFKECPDYVEIVLPAIDRRRYKI